MRRGLRIVALVVLALVAGLILTMPGWLEPSLPIEFTIVTLASMVVAAATAQHPAARRRGTMTPSYVIEFCAMLRFGPGPGALASCAGALVRSELRSRGQNENTRALLADAVVVTSAMLAAGFTNGALGGARGHFVWPAQALPITAAALAFGLVTATAAQVVAPLIGRRKLERDWPVRVLHEVPPYVVGAAVAAGLAEIVDHQAWPILLVAALPLFFAYLAYCRTIGGLEEVHRRQEVIDSLHAMSVVDSAGLIVRWNDALERMVNRRREHALGLTLAKALPSLKTTALPAAVADTLKDGGERTLSVSLGTGADAVLVEVTVVKVDDGVTLLWQDMTARLQAEQTLRRASDRLALSAEGASDGWWEWDMRSESLHVSKRWKAMLGIPEADEIVRLDDWITRVHPDDAPALKDALKAHLQGSTERLQHDHRIRHEDGTYRWFMCSGVRASGRRPSRIAGSLSDVTDRVAAQEQLRNAAFLDPLTGLRNRADFVERVGRRLAELERRKDKGRFAVLYLDLDRFKFVNDSLGHLVGDELLIAVSRRLESCLRADDYLGRLGGDEFAILLDTVHDDSQANAVAFRIQDVLKPSISTGGREVFTSASIGIAVSHPDYNGPDEIMRDADTAMYVAKSQGKACHKLFDAAMHARTRDRLSLESDLRRAVEALDFEVHYQPIVLLSSGVCVGFESLVRWTRNGEKISPAVFIPIAEELGLIEPIGTWVLQRACREFADWKRRFPEAGLDCITVNASSRQLTQPNYPYLVEQAIQSTGVTPADLRIEVTETALMDAPNVAARVLSELRDLGVKVYLDDFGTGCSSLSHLHTLPVDALKVDRSFVTSLLLPERPPIVESILALARTLKTSVVAEGIEYEKQARELERLGCTHAQGYLFSRPISSDAVEELLLTNLPLGPKREATSCGGDPAAFAALGAVGLELR